MNVSNRDNPCTNQLILSQRTSSRGQSAALIIQQASLELIGDSRQIVLRRYFEHYSPGHGEWVEYAHTVEVSELINWIMAQGHLHIEHPPEVPVQPRGVQQ